MDDKTRQTLAAVFDARAAQAVQQPAAADQAAEGVARFLALRDSVIRPALDEIATYLAHRGQSAHVALSSATQHALELALFDAGTTPRPLHDRLCFIHDTARGGVRMYAHHAEYSGPYGARVPMDAVTPAWVQEQCTAWFVSLQPAPARARLFQR